MIDEKPVLMHVVVYGIGDTDEECERSAERHLHYALQEAPGGRIDWFSDIEAVEVLQDGEPGRCDRDASLVNSLLEECKRLRSANNAYRNILVNLQRKRNATES